MKDNTENNLENFHTSIKSVLPEEGTPIIKGYDFDKGINYDSLIESFHTMGFQATNVYKAIQEINSMLNWRGNFDGEEKKCTIFLGYTSNMISCGMREIIKFIVKHKLVDCIVTTAGGVEEDFMKCLTPTYLGSFELNGRELRMKGQNRIGNLIVPNKNYCEFEDWLTPILDKMVQEQNDEKNPVHWSPSKMIERLGKEINNEDSVYYWAYKNGIPVFCPALTDGSIGDMIYFHSYSVEKPLILDIVQDIRYLNSIAVFAKKSGMIIIGGGVVKHHICNSNLMRNGADYSVFINTGQEYDGSDSGARPDEALSWGKININANPVKVYSEATLVFPFIVAKTFAKYYYEQKEKKEKEEKEKK